MENSQLKLSNQICFPLYSVSRLITKAYKPYLDQMNITYPQYLVLMVLWENDSLFVSDIKEKLMLETNTLSPLLKRMEKLELIKRKRSIKDERKVIILLEQKGKLLKQKAEPIPNELLNQLLSESINLNEVLQLKELLNQWINMLTEKK